MNHRIDRINFDDFNSRTDFGSICDPEPPWHSLDHATHDPDGWKDALNREIENLTHQHEKIDTAADVFDQGLINPEGHYGLEVDGIRADNPEDAALTVRDGLDNLGFESGRHLGFPQGGEQFWRDSPDGQSQEHLRFYGVTDQPDGTYKAIFVAEGDRLPDTPDLGDAARAEQGFKEAQPLTEGPMRSEQGFKGIEPLADGKAGDSRTDMPDEINPDISRDVGDGGRNFRG